MKARCHHCRSIAALYRAAIGRGTRVPQTIRQSLQRALKSTATVTFALQIQVVRLAAVQKHLHTIAEQVQLANRLAGPGQITAKRLSFCSNVVSALAERVHRQVKEGDIVAILCCAAARFRPFARILTHFIPSAFIFVRGSLCRPWLAEHVEVTPGLCRSSPVYL